MGLPLLLLASSGLALRRSPLAAWQSGNHSLGAHGPAARSLGARPPDPGEGLLPLGISEHTAIILLLSVYAGSLLALALGFHTRLSAFLAWGLHLSLVTSGFASYYGVDQLANTFLFYLLLFPSGRAGRSRSRRRRDETIPVGCLRVMQIHLCVIYLAAGLDKAMGSQWWNGEAIWQTVSQPIFSTFDLSWLARHSWIPMLAGWGTLVVEIGYAFLIWPRRTRKAWCIATIGLHLGTCLFMGLVFFSSVMILLTSCLFLIPEEVTERAVAPRRRLVQAALLVAICLLPLGLAASDRSGTRADERTRFADFAPLVRRLMARDQIPGVAVGVVERGQLVFARGFGYRDVEKHLPVTPDTLFPLGSCSKAFTATAIALLADEGRIALDAPVRTYLPDFALADPVASATLTTRDLLTHRSGLPRHDLFWYQAPFSRDELYHRLRFLEPSRSAARAVAIQQPDVRRRRSNRREASRARAGRASCSLGSSRPSTCVARCSRRKRWRPTPIMPSPYALRDGRVQQIPMLKRLERDRARGSRADERERSRPLAHVSRDEIARAARGRHVA